MPRKRKGHQKDWRTTTSDQLYENDEEQYIKKYKTGHKWKESRISYYWASEADWQQEEPMPLSADSAPSGGASHAGFDVGNPADSSQRVVPPPPPPPVPPADAPGSTHSTKAKGEGKQSKPPAPQQQNPSDATQSTATGSVPICGFNDPSVVRTTEGYVKCARSQCIRCSYDGRRESYCCRSCASYQPDFNVTLIEHGHVCDHRFQNFLGPDYVGKKKKKSKQR